MGWGVKIKLDKQSRANLSRIADLLERLTLIASASRFTFKLSIGDIMPVYKSDKADFDAQIVISATDSEGNVIENAPIPEGHSLTVGSDNAACFAVAQDANDARLLHCHVGGPNADGSPSQANVTANLTDPAGNLVATGAAQVTVTVGDPAAITGINLNLPEA